MSKISKTRKKSPQLQVIQILLLIGLASDGDGVSRGAGSWVNSWLAGWLLAHSLTCALTLHHGGLTTEPGRVRSGWGGEEAKSHSGGSCTQGRWGVLK
jgi:hypothetical protein